MKKKLIFLFVFFCISFFNNSKEVKAQIYSGTTYNGQTWLLDTSDGILDIRGTANLPNYTKGEAPWLSLSDEILHIRIDPGINEIGNYNFYNLINAKDIDFGTDSSVNCFGEGSFYNSGLTSIDIPSNVYEIKSNAFADCNSLISVSGGSNVRTLHSFAFNNCNSLSSVDEFTNLKEIHDYAFYNCPNLTSIVLPESLSFYGNYTYQNRIFSKTGINNVTFKNYKVNFNRAEINAVDEKLINDYQGVTITAVSYTHLRAHET